MPWCSADWQACSCIACVRGRPEQQRSARGRGAWAGVSLAGIALSCAVAVTFPFFSTVTAVVAALGDLAGAYTLPALFVLVRAAPSLHPACSAMGSVPCLSWTPGLSCVSSAVAPASTCPDKAVMERTERWLLLDCCLVSGVCLVIPW